MVDPISTGVLSGVASITTKSIINSIFDKEVDELEEWRATAIEAATEVQAAYQFHHDRSNNPSSDALQRKIGSLGEFVEKLSVIAEQRDFSMQDQEAVQGLSEVCGRLSSVNLSMSDASPEPYRDDIEEAVGSVFDLADQE